MAMMIVNGLPSRRRQQAGTRGFTRLLSASLFLVPVLLAVTPVAANHPGGDLDKVMADKEPYFQAIGRSAPSFELTDAQGKLARLSDYSGKVIVLHFIYASCPDICPLHADKLAEVQALVNDTPMRELVQFLSVSTDPSNDTAEVREAFGPAHGLDPANWRFLATTDPALEGRTRKLAEAFGHSFSTTPDGQQTHGAVTHVIGPDGTWAANFHGVEFKPLNLVLYLNGVVNNAHGQSHNQNPGWWSRITDFLWGEDT